ncbi:MAG: hypothetical protein PGN13_16245 [Patulibacter minatonensis]
METLPWPSAGRAGVLVDEFLNPRRCRSGAMRSAKMRHFGGNPSADLEVVLAWPRPDEHLHQIEDEMLDLTWAVRREFIGAPLPVEAQAIAGRLAHGWIAVLSDDTRVHVGESLVRVRWADNGTPAGSVRLVPA